MIRTIRLLAGLAALLTPLHTFAAESVYTDVDTDHCKTLSQPADDQPGDFVSLKCKGYKDYPLYYAEGDLRQTVHFGHLDKEIIDQAFETFGPFNYISRKVEWRLDDSGLPYAAILRYFIQNANPDTAMADKPHEGQVLVISRVGQPDDKRGCVIGYVDALENPEPNALARKVADEMAENFVCGKDRPVFHGDKTEPGNDPAYNFPGASQQ